MLSEQRAGLERDAVKQALKKAKGNRTLVARLLGVSRRTLYTTSSRPSVSPTENSRRFSRARRRRRLTDSPPGAVTGWSSVSRMVRRNRLNDLSGMPRAVLRSRRARRMARVYGKDLIIELMETVRRLDQGMARQEEVNERILARLDLMSERTNAIAGQLGVVSGRLDDLTQRMNDLTQRMNELTQRMNELTQRMNELTQRMNELTERMNEVAGDVTSLRSGFVELAADQSLLGSDFARFRVLTQELRQNLRRLTELFLQSLDTSTDRFDELEARLAALEKKTG
ncbi:MAG: hypothetical protein IT380_17580 [Myxococcales bacterium]|nr:hypothetical protein [Myxococcales bacterium]